MEHAEEILKDLPKYKLYDKLNENGDKDSYLLQGVNDENERCRYFTFWIHDNIRKLLNTHSKDQGKIYTISNRFSFDLFDYITNYTEIQNKLNPNLSLCPKYLNYMSYIERVYENYSKECCNGNAKKCHFTFGSNPWCSQGYTLPKLICDKNQVLGDSMGGGEDEVTRQQHRTRSPSSQFSLASDGDSVSNDNMPLNYSGYYVKISLGLLLSGITFTLFYMYK
ncbi:PIR Superfamily Protein, partial [Plasmodium ovale curtisi]